MDNGRKKADDGLNGPFGPRQGMYKYDRILDKNLTQTVEYLEELCTKVCVCVSALKKILRASRLSPPAVSVFRSPSFVTRVLFTTAATFL